MVNSPNIKSTILDSKSDLLDKIIYLSSKNSATLGFLPKGVFAQKAAEGKLIVAVEADNLLGYILFEYNMTNHIAYIVHLCVDAKYRRLGISKILLQFMEEIIKGKVAGIRVRCREDYDASVIWPKLGFEFIQKIPGRSKKGSILCVWRKNLPFPDLFHPIIEQKGKVLTACLDLNIISNCFEPLSDSTSSAHSLIQDWLAEVVDFYISPEFSVELERLYDQQKKEKIMSYAHTLIRIKAPTQQYELVRPKIEKLFKNTIQDQSDLNHIAWCASGNIDYFVTGDEGILGKSGEIYELLGLKIIHPSDLILNTDILLRRLEYQPIRFGGSGIFLKRIQASDFDEIVSIFANESYEGKRKFVAKLRTVMSNPRDITTQLIIHNERLLGIISYEINMSGKLIVKLIRLVTNVLTNTLSEGIIKWLIEESLSKKVTYICVSDKPLSSSIIFACSKFGFFEEGGNLIRLTECGCLCLPEIRDKMTEYEQRNILPPRYCKQVRCEIDRAKSSSDKLLLIQLEKDLWPLKIKELKLPNYIVSIWPKYAMHLFDREISAEDLFGGDSKLLLNIENAYYRSLMGTKIKAPGRILWYVGKGERHYSNSQAIRAASYLNEIHVGEPKEMFSRFQHLGIYKWKDIIATVHEDSKRPLMVLIFSHTEIFDKPILRNKLDKLWKNEKNTNFSVQGPVSVTDDLFWKIYSIGKGLDHG